MKAKIKASTISNLTDARYFAARGVDFIGLNINESSESALKETDVRGIIDWLEGPLIVGEFGMKPAKEILDITKRIGLQAIQIEMFYPVEEIRQLKGNTLLQEIVLSDQTDIPLIEKIIITNSPFISLYILNFEKIGMSWKELQANQNLLNQIRSWSDAVSILLQIPFEAAELHSILALSGVDGFSISGGEEEKIGFKSFDHIDSIFDIIEE